MAKLWENVNGNIVAVQPSTCATNISKQNRRKKKTNHNNQIVIHFQANAVETNKFHRREVAVLSDLNISVQIHINKKLSCRNVQVFLKSNRKQKHQLYK